MSQRGDVEEHSHDLTTIRIVSFAWCLPGWSDRAVRFRFRVASVRRRHIKVAAFRAAWRRGKQARTVAPMPQANIKNELRDNGSRTYRESYRQEG
jgi:hypothetical protein